MTQKNKDIIIPNVDGEHDLTIPEEIIKKINITNTGYALYRKPDSWSVSDIDRTLDYVNQATGSPMLSFGARDSKLVQLEGKKRDAMIVVDPQIDFSLSKEAAPEINLEIFQHRMRSYLLPGIDLVVVLGNGGENYHITREEPDRVYCGDTVIYEKGKGRVKLHPGDAKDVERLMKNTSPDFTEEFKWLMEGYATASRIPDETKRNKRVAEAKNDLYRYGKNRGINVDVMDKAMAAFLSTEPDKKKKS